MRPDFKILLVEDVESFRDSVIQMLGVYNEIDTAVDLKSGREAIQKNSYEVVILDKSLPDGNGLDLITEIKLENPNSVVIILTADDDLNTVKKSMLSGADDYVVKSPNVTSDLLVRIPYVVERAAERRHLSSLKDQVRVAFKYELIGKSVSTYELRAAILGLKGSTSHVLVTGESGTGKELIARRLNAIEEAKLRQLVVVNCGAIPENLIESELFGHKRGSFSGAFSDKAGKFELAHNGDIFLDEIGDLPLSAQVKLLRVIQDGQFFRIGGIKPVQISCRVIAATNKDIEDMVRRGQFREDLYYRLNVVRLRSTPLRSRMEDVPDLIRFFSLQIGGTSVTVSDRAIIRLAQHDWPGNIRELRNTVERAILLARRRGSTQIDSEDISIDLLHGPGAGIRKLQATLPVEPSDVSKENFKAFLEIAEREYMTASLLAVKDKVNELGPKLGYSRSGIFKKLEQLEIPRRPYVSRSTGETKGKKESLETGTINLEPSL